MDMFNGYRVQNLLRRDVFGFYGAAKSVSIRLLFVFWIWLRALQWQSYNGTLRDDKVNKVNMLTHA